MELQDLTFKKEGSLYVCEFEAAGPFNIKITRANVPGAYGALPGTLSMQQSLTGEDFVPVPLPQVQVINFDYILGCIAPFQMQKVLLLLLSKSPITRVT